jgi:hypothetical protein
MLALLNTTNGADLTYADFKLGDPIALPPVYLPKADPLDPDEPLIVDRSADNTKITATGINDYSQSVELTYRRLNLDFEVQYIRYFKTDFTDWADFLAKFGPKNDIRTEELVFTPSVMPSTPGQHDIVVTPTAKSLIYFGTKTIRITV